jgi:hypothetical protein
MNFCESDLAPSYLETTYLHREMKCFVMYILKCIFKKCLLSSECGECSKLRVASIDCATVVLSLAALACIRTRPAERMCPMADSTGLVVAGGRIN